MRAGVPMVLGCLVLGVLVNIGIAVLIPLHTPGSALYYGGWIRGGRCRWPRPVPESWSAKPFTTQESSCFGYREVIAHSGLVTGEGAPDGQICSLIIKESGWPLPCLAAEYWHAGPSKGGRRMISVDAPWWLGSCQDNLAFGDIGVLPLSIGMIANTLFFGALSFAIVVPSARLYRKRRRVPGSCPACGYDCRGLSACPECSRPVEALQGR